MAKSEKAKIDLSALFVKSEKVAVSKHNSKAGFFNNEILLSATAQIMKTQDALNVDGFYNMAKIGTANNDENHKRYYVNRAIKMAMLNIKHGINLLDSNFNDPASTKILKEYLNNKAFKMMDVRYADGTEGVELNVDMNTAFKK